MAAIPRTAQETKSPRRPVLIVDDDLDIREVLAETLEHRGFDVATAANGLEALKLLRSKEVSPSIVLLDLMMPVLDGYGFLAEQRNDPALASIPVAIVSAGHRVDQDRIGDAPILTKPIDVTRLVEVVRELADETPVGAQQPDRRTSHEEAPPLTVSEAHFRLLVSSIKDYAIFMLDPLGRISTWNAGAQEIKGYLPEEVIGKHIDLFYTPEDIARQKPQKLLAAASRDGRVEDEGWRVRKDGSRFWADVVITALRDSDGKLQGFAKVTRDLTSRRAHEEKLRMSEASLSATLYSIGDGVLATDDRGRITRINPVAERLTGWSEGEACGRPVEEVFNIINERTRAKATNPIGRVLKEGIVVGLANHTALISRDGIERPIADSGAPIRDGEGVPGGAVLVFRDVTEERRAEQALRESEEKFRITISAVRDYAIVTLDPHGHIVSWNPGAEQMTGYREEEMLGSDITRLFLPEDVKAGKPARELEIAAKEGRYEDEAWRVRKDGTPFWANVIVTAAHDISGRLVGFTKITRDLTERRRMEEERLRLAQAQEAIRLRDEFLSIASHELRTPLTALQLQLEIIRERVESFDEKLAKKMDRATRAGERMADLIEALLDVSRIATGKLTLKVERCDLVETAHDVVERVRDAATSAGCDLSVAADGPVVGQWDRLRIEQVLTNLLANAIKYAAGKPIALSVRQSDGAAVLELCDHGPGLSDSDLTRVFGRFERASVQGYGGLGLGLYIARQIAEAHGGTVTARNGKRGGACFTMRLPFHPASASTHVSSASENGARSTS